MPVQTAITDGGDEELARKIAEAEAAMMESPPIADNIQILATENEDRYVEIRGQRFKINSNIPGMVLLDVALAGDPASDDFERVRGLKSFLDAAIVPEQKAEFNALLRNTENPIGIDELNSVVEKIVEQVSGRPTEQQ